MNVDQVLPCDDSFRRQQALCSGDYDHSWYVGWWIRVGARICEFSTEIKAADEAENFT